MNIDVKILDQILATKFSSTLKELYIIEKWDLLSELKYSQYTDNNQCNIYYINRMEGKKTWLSWLIHLFMTKRSTT